MQRGTHGPPKRRPPPFSTETDASHRERGGAYDLHTMREIIQACISQGISNRSKKQKQYEFPLDFSEFLRDMLLNVDQASVSHFLGCRNSSITELGPIDLLASGPAEVICPKPFRPRASHMINDVDRNWPRQEGGLTSDLLDLFPAELDKRDVPDVSGCD
ncbi:hypothetical protein NL676_015228 [Syzygium grande]|nr:hypothetical protein NL676_015228 [Syzygium grande]